ncbi:MAG: hypothetical protein A4E30_00116 [Methanomassiliicoccales archaeon PtaB.Bin215]|nr:MAG: hypothetical protein A4E30_00116 [Methanomassiliicoccales archaeon PtaB.Bin215]
MDTLKEAAGGEFLTVISTVVESSLPSRSVTVRVTV